MDRREAHRPVARGEVMSGLREEFGVSRNDQHAADIHPA